MRRGAAILIALIGAGAAAAEPSASERAAFEACVAEGYAANIENFTASMGVPVICGSQHIPPEQSCSFLGKLADPVGCVEKDHAYWMAELSANLAAYNVETIAENSLLDTGLKRCAAETEDGVARQSCEIEVVWRDTMITWAIPVMDAVQEAAK